MANLLAKPDRRPPFRALPGERLVRLESRLRKLSRIWMAPGGADRLSTDAVSFAALAPELAELEQAPSVGAAHALVHAVDEARQALSERAFRFEEENSRAWPDGDWLCYWPGRSLSTGEAEIASRGFYDILDRPPLGLWLEVLDRASGHARGEFEVTILVWTPAAVRERARAGRRAATSGALSLLDDEACAPLRAQLEALCKAGNAD